MTELAASSPFRLTDLVWRGAYSPHTLAQYEKQAKRWMRYAPESPFPVAAQDWLAYLVQMRAEGVSASYLRQANAMMRLVHQARNAESPTDTHEVKMFLRGVVRETRRPEQAVPMRKPDYDELREKMLSRSNIDRRDLAIIGVMRACMLRRTELCALRLEDIDGDLLLIRRSKTDQEGRGAVAYLPKQVRADLDDWVRVGEVMPKDRGVFLTLHKTGRVRRGRKPVSVNDIGKIIAAVCRRHRTAKTFTTHSMRVGMAMDLVENGAGVIETQLAGRWASPAMPAYYARGKNARDGAIAKYWEENDA